jgi:hypothetical protein
LRQRGLWELPSARLEQLAAALARRGAEPVTAVGLQRDGFDAAVCGALVGMEARTARVLVETLLGERAAHPRPELELVWTGREVGATQSRDTQQVVAQLFGGAERRVMIAGFAFHEADRIFEPLHARAAQLGLELELFLHFDGTGRNEDMTPVAFLQKSWPWRDVTPRLYYDVRAETGRGGSSMHAKCIIVDDREVLITSANFTTRAQHDNIELGVLIRDESFAARVSGQWRALVAHGLFREHRGPR